MGSSTADRIRRVRELGYQVQDQPQEQVPACNLCGGQRWVRLVHSDRYGYATRACGCRRCGLVFLSPRLTAEGYGRFYDGAYRPLVSAYHGRLINADTIQAEQAEYAAERAEFLAEFLPEDGGELLDIGGSTGVVAAYLAQRFGLSATILDPAPAEIEAAQQLGLETITGLVEDFDAAGRSFDLVIMCQTVDHLLDVAGTLARIRDLLSEEGFFFVDIVDFRAAYLGNGSIEQAVKIDHPYYLTEETMTAYLRRAGFSILGVDYAADHLHVGYLCRRAMPDPEYLPDVTEVARLWREIRAVQNQQRTP